MYTLVKGDTATQIQATLTRHDDGTAVDCAGGTVKMYFRKKGTTAVLSTLVAESFSERLQNGIALFSFDDNSLDVDAGVYEGEIEVKYVDGSVESVFEILNFRVRDDF